MAGAASCLCCFCLPFIFDTMLRYFSRIEKKNKEGDNSCENTTTSQGTSSTNTNTSSASPSSCTDGTEVTEPTELCERSCSSRTTSNPRETELIASLKNKGNSYLFFPTIYDRTSILN